MTKRVERSDAAIGLYINGGVYYNIYLSPIKNGVRLRLVFQPNGLHKLTSNEPYSLIGEEWLWN